jgi:hypothetical protein
MALPKNLKNVMVDGKIADNPTFDFPIEDFRIQLDINPKESNKQLQGTQARKLLYTNLYEGGKPKDPKYKQWLDENIETLEQIADIERKNLYDVAGITETTDEDGNTSFTIKNYNALKEMVKDELISREYPINTVESLNSIIDTKGNLLGTIDGLPSRQKIMNLLNSIVTNRLIKLYTNGSSLVQVSQQGWEMQAGSTVDTPSAIDFISKEAKQSYIDNKGLKFFNIDKTTGAAECILPAKYRNFVKKDEEGNYILDDEQVLLNIGYRIPTQAHNSMLHLKVIGFLPEHLDQMIILPKEITTQGGSDFDVDKVNIFIPNSIILDGKIKYISADMDAETVYNKLKDEQKNKEAFDKLITNIFGEVKEDGTIEPYDLGEEEEQENIKNKQVFINKFKKKQLQNKLIEQAVRILEDPIVREQLLTPNSADQLKEAGKEVARKLKEAGRPTKKLELTWDNIFKGNTLVDIIYQMFASKALVGVFASQSTHHTLSQQVGLHFKSGRPFFFDHNKTPEGLADLSQIKGKTDLVISDRLGNEYLTAAVDAAKDDYLTELGINLQTGDVAALFERSGGNPKYLYAWLQVPIIQTYLEKLSSNNAITTKSMGLDTNKNNIIVETLKEYNLGNSELAYLNKDDEDLENTINNDRAERGDYSIKQVEELAFGKQLPENAVQMQLDLLDDFLYFQDAALVLRKSISTTKFDTAGPGKNLAESNLLKYKYDAFVKEMSGDKGYTLGAMENNEQQPYTDLIQKTQLKVFYKNSFNFVNAIYQDLTVLQKSQSVKDTFRLLIDPSLNVVKKYADPYEADIVYGAIVNYLIQNKVGFNESLFYGDNTLGHKIIEIQNDPNHPLHDNPIISDFFNIELSPSDTQPTVLSPLIKSLSADEASYYTGKFEEIKVIDPKLYEDFINVSLFQSGVVQSPLSYYNQLPHYDIIPLVNQAIKDSIGDFKSIDAIEMIAKNVGNKLRNLHFYNTYGSKYNKNTGTLTTGRDLSLLFFRGKIPGTNIQSLFFKESPKIYSELVKPKPVGFYNYTNKYVQSNDVEPQDDIAYENEENTSENITFEEWYKTSKDVNPFEDEDWNRNYFNKCVKK